MGPRPLNLDQEISQRLLMASGPTLPTLCLRFHPLLVRIVLLGISNHPGNGVQLWQAIAFQGIVLNIAKRSAR